MKNKSRWKSIPQEEFKKIIKSSYSIREVVHKCGYSCMGGTHKEISNEIKEKGYSIDHFKRLALPKHIRNAEMFSENSIALRKSVKREIIEKKLLKYVCSECNLDPFWNDKKLILVLDHINGINNDNRLKNLRFLCPNCNSQQETFTGKNQGMIPDNSKMVLKIIEAKKEKLRIDKEKEASRIKNKKIKIKFSKKIKRYNKVDLIKILKKTRSFKGASRIVGFSDNTVKKRCLKLKIDFDKIFNLDYKKEEMITSYKKTKNLTKTASKFNTSVNNLKRIIKNDVKIPPLLITTSYQRNRIKKLRSKGLTIKEISEKVGVSTVTVKKYK